MSFSKTTLFLAAIVLACMSFQIEAFAPPSSSIVGGFSPRSTVVIRESSDETTESSGEEGPEKVSLEEKMKSWEASEEEIRAASLGGVIPQPRERTEAFDIGLYIAFPIMVLTGLAFAFFPFIMGNIDVSNIEVPRE